jgi:hypothetical protein
MSVDSVDPAASDEAADAQAAIEGSAETGRDGFRAAARVDMMALSHGWIILT